MISSASGNQLIKEGTAMKKQQGATVMGMLFIAALVGSGLILAAKLVPAYVEWVKKALEGLGIAKPVMIGHSLGAAICLTFAIRWNTL